MTTRDDVRTGVRGTMGWWALGAAALMTTLAASATWRPATQAETGAGPSSPSIPSVMATALPVQVASLRLQDAYQSARRYVGQVEPARQSAVGFELGGQLAGVLADEGDTVEAGQIIARLDQARLRAREAELAAQIQVARAALVLERSTRTRIVGLNGQGHASDQRLDEAEQRLNAARATLRLAEARMASLRTDLEKTLLRAPYRGVVVARSADEGRVLAPGEPVVTVMASGPAEVRIGLPQREVDGLGIGDTVEVIVGERAVAATVKAVLPVAGPRTRVVDVILVLDAAPHPSRPGTLVEFERERTVHQRGAWVPSTALAAGPRGTWTLYTVLGSGTAEPARMADAGDSAPHVALVRVELTAQEGERSFVTGPFDSGALIITAGLNRVVPGQRVEPLLVNEAEAGR